MEDELELDTSPVTQDDFEEGITVNEDGSIEIELEDTLETFASNLEFYDNLVEAIDENNRVALATMVQEGFEADCASRKNWFRRYESALKVMDPEPTPETGSKRDQLGLAKVTHPMIAEVAQNFQARAIGELCPKGGNVSTRVLGDDPDDKVERADRVERFMNYQITTQMTEYFPDTDRMLYHLGFVGHTFKKAWFDPVLKRPTIRFTTAEEVVVHDQDTKDLQSCPRISHRIYITRDQYDRLVAEGYYEALPDGTTSDEEEINTVIKDIEGISPVREADDMVYLIEQHVYATIEEDDKAGELANPYIITVHPTTNKVVRVQRNWNPDGEEFKKLEWFVDYCLLPGFGYYGYGYWHLLNGLNDAATGAMRSLLDSAEYANLQGGFKLQGAIKGGDVTIGAGEYVPVNATVDDVRKAVMSLPFKEPSPAMMNMLTFLDGRGTAYAGSLEEVVAKAGPNTPVGTIMAIIEETSKPQSAIFRRLTESQGREFKILYRLNFTYMDDEYPYEVEGGEEAIFRKDFQPDIEVVPTSDPESFNATKRVARAQLVLEMAEKYPEFHDKYEAVKGLYEAARIPDYDDYLIDPNETSRLDAMTENVAIMSGKPVKAYEDQDHTAHIMVLDQWFSTLPPQFQGVVQTTYMSHRAEHMALLYRAQAQAVLGEQLPPLPENLAQTKTRFDDMDPQMDAMITQAVAVRLNQGAQIGSGPPVPPPPGQEQGQQPDPAQMLMLQAQAEAETIRAKAAADIEASNAKAQNQIQVEQAKAGLQQQTKVQEAQTKQQIEGAKAAQQMQVTEAKAALDMQVKLAEVQANLQALMLKTQADIAMANDKLRADMLNDMRKVLAETQMKQAQAETEAVRQIADVTDME